MMPLCRMIFIRFLIIFVKRKGNSVFRFETLLQNFLSILDAFNESIQIKVRVNCLVDI